MPPFLKDDQACPHADQDVEDSVQWYEQQDITALATVYHAPTHPNQEERVDHECNPKQRRSQRAVDAVGVQAGRPSLGRQIHEGRGASAYASDRRRQHEPAVPAAFEAGPAPAQAHPQERGKEGREQGSGPRQGRARRDKAHVGLGARLLTGGTDENGEADDPGDGNHGAEVILTHQWPQREDVGEHRVRGQKGTRTHDRGQG
mmetsp:Transcript_58481/g.181630  ORF Transcript_58481/g.181630 Transcript_58481/m.181630 type:complete len:203 (-) Transcript_58481:110-718(-)